MTAYRSKPENAVAHEHAFAPLRDGWEYTAIPVLDSAARLHDGTPLCFRPTMKTGLEALARLGLEALAPDDVEFLHAEAVAGRCIELPAFTSTPTAEVTLEWHRVSDEANWKAVAEAGWMPGMRICNWGKIIVDGPGRPADGMWIMGWWVPNLARYTPPAPHPQHRSGPGFIQPRPTPGRAPHGFDTQADDGTLLVGKRRIRDTAPSPGSGPGGAWAESVLAPLKAAGSTIMSAVRAAADLPARSDVELGGHELPILGIDVSKHQGLIDWKRVAADPQGFRFAYVKLGEGVNYVDPMAARNVHGARDAGLEVGVYHYLRVRAGAAQDSPEQAFEFLAAMRTMPVTLLPCLDVETANNEGRPYTAYLAAIRGFGDVVKRELSRPPMLYTYPAFWAASSALTGAKDLAEWPLWLARYNTRPPVVPPPWTEMTGWQFAAGAGVIGHADGVAGPCDIDRLFGGLDQLRLRA